MRLCRMTKKIVVYFFYLIGLVLLDFLATDMYLSAFDKLRTDLDTTKSSIDATLSLFLAG